MTLPLVGILVSCDGPDEMSDPGRPPFDAPDEVSPTPTRNLARQAENYLVHYGSWDAERIAVAQAHDLVILDPNADGVDRATIAAIQNGGAPDDRDARVIVLCYVSVGEDSRTAGLSDAEMAGDPRFAGNGTGPRVDPRGPDAGEDQPLTGIDPLGRPSPGGSGWASWYLDDVSVHRDSARQGDGIPDRNSLFGGYFVNAGDPAWFDALQAMTTDGPDGIAGLREMLTTEVGRGFGCDGVFMDTFDTAAPNHWTDPSSPNETKFEWTAPGFAAFVGRLRAAYPDAVILQNRASFFFNPKHPHFLFHPGADLDLLLFESFRLNSDAWNNPHPYYYPDNRFNFTPKLMAEAGRPGGFEVLSLGYAEGPVDQMSELTLVGDSSLGYASLVEDIEVTERWAGFRHYLTDASVSLVNRFVVDHADRTDTTPPRWTSTHNDNAPGYPAPPGEPTPRVGIQEVLRGPGKLTVRWDIALDFNPVRYALYIQTTPFEIAGDDLDLSAATRIVLPQRRPARYSGGTGPGVYANEATITGLDPEKTYYLLIRAFDSAANEDDNQVVLSASPTRATTYLGRWHASSTESQLTYGFSFTGSWIWHRVLIDRDRLPGTGYRVAGIGADLMIENDGLYRYSGSGRRWSWSRLGPVTMTGEDGTVRWELSPDDIGAGVRQTRLVFQVHDLFALETSDPHDHDHTAAGRYAENDAATVHYSAELGGGGPACVFIDRDASARTGLAVGGIGADFLIDGEKLYRHVGPGWSWELVGTIEMSVDGGRYDWWIDRADLGAGIGAPFHRLVFQAGDDSITPIYRHRFSP